jgi:hypothetical protein
MSELEERIEMSLRVMVMLLKLSELSEFIDEEAIIKEGVRQIVEIVKAQGALEVRDEPI